MWRILLLIIAVISALLPSHQVDEAVAFWHGISGFGLGGGPNLVAQNVLGAPASLQPSQYYDPPGNDPVSTADYYHLDGVAWMRPYDLTDPACGTVGASIAASKGRYVWVASPDHPDQNFSWGDGQDFRLGFSTDPFVPPIKLDTIILFNNAVSAAGQNFALYQVPWFVCNPDDASFPFWVYGEGYDRTPGIMHEEGGAKSADLQTWTLIGPTHLNSNSAQWSSFQRVVRDGLNLWHSTGLDIDFNPSPRAANGKWTGSIASSFSESNAYFNTCLPVNSPTGTRPCPDGSDQFSSSAAPDTFMLGGQAYTIMRREANVVSNSNTAGEYLTRVPVDSNFNILASPSSVNISNKYSGVYPGPTYLQSANAYIEDGVGYYYVQHGFPPSSANQSLTNAAPYSQGGGLWQQNLDFYSEIINSSLAVNAAPAGVTASAAAGVVTLKWYNVLPNNTYRVYWGTSANSQPNLIGDVTGTSTTITTNLQVPVVLYYKVVTLNSGVEEKSRVVSTYVSSSTAHVNAHMTRVLAAGADPGTIDRAWLDTVDNWLVNTCGCYSNLLFWTNPAFGVIQNTSNIVSTVFDYGTTRLPRGGDLTFCTGSNPCTPPGGATYNPTGLNGTTPVWANPIANTTLAYYGGAGPASGIPGRLNQLRRKTQLTMMASYSKPNTNSATLLAIGNFGGVNLEHTSGSPGSASFCVTPNSAGCGSFTATSAISGSATAPHVIGGTFDGTTTIAYADGAAGTGVTGYTANPNLQTVFLNNTALNSIVGQIGAPTNMPYLNSGAQDSEYTYGTGYRANALQAQFSASDLVVLDKALSPSLMASLTTLLQNRVSPPADIVYNITTFNASACNGSGNDNATFTSFNSTALTYQSGHPGALIELDIPQGGVCVFSSAGSSNPFLSGLKNVRVVGLGSGATFNDNGGTGNGVFFGSNAGAAEDNLHQDRIATVSRGATSVTLQESQPCMPTCVGLFHVGDWARVAGVDPAGFVMGYPDDPAFWDFVKITGIVGETISFTPPLTHDYKLTWPHYQSGDSSHIDQGGPATIYAYDQKWDTVQEINNLTVIQNGPVPTAGRDITFKNVTINCSESTLGSYPTQNMSWRFIGGSQSGCTLEIDKVIDLMLFQNAAVTSLTYQSASVKQTLISEATISSLTGSGPNITVANSTITNWGFGTQFFGAAYGETRMYGNVIAAATAGGAAVANAKTVGSWSGGTYTIPNASISSVTTGMNSALPFVPGANIYWAATASVTTGGPMIQITDLSQSGGNTVVTTTLGSGPPVLPGTDANWKIHPAPQYFGSGNTGAALNAFELNPPLAQQGAPLGSYYSQTITHANGDPASPIIPYVWGQMVETDWTINPGCSGASNFRWVPTNFIQTLGSTTIGTWAPTADAATASTTPRQMFPTSVAGSMGLDNLVSPGANTWLNFGQEEPSYQTIANCVNASTLVTITTNQGVVNPVQE